MVVPSHAPRALLGRSLSALALLVSLAGCTALAPAGDSSVPSTDSTAPLYEGQQGAAECPATESFRDQLVPGGVVTCVMTDEASGATFSMTFDIVDDQGGVGWRLDPSDTTAGDSWFRQVTSGKGGCPSLTDWGLELSPGGSFLCGMTDTTGAVFGLRFTVIDEAGQFGWSFSP